MKHLEDKDIREALRRTESRRQQTEEPTDFFENVMEEINNIIPQAEVVPMRHSPASRKRNIAVIFSAAAAIALVLFLVWPRFAGTTQKQAQKEEFPDSMKLENNNYKSEIAEVMTLPDESEPRKDIDTKLMENAGAAHNISNIKEMTSHLRQQDSHVVASTSANATDSLQYYIDKIERELAKLDDSLYIDRMNKLISADERLQRIVNSYILHTLDEEGRPQAVLNIFNKNPQENEDK